MTSYVALLRGINVVRSHQQLRTVVTKAPAGFGTQPDRYHPIHDVKRVLRQGLPQGCRSSRFARLSRDTGSSRTGSMPSATAAFSPAGPPPTTTRSWAATDRVL